MDNPNEEGNQNQSVEMNPGSFTYMPSGQDTEMGDQSAIMQTEVPRDDPAEREAQLKKLVKSLKCTFCLDMMITFNYLFYSLNKGGVFFGFVFLFMFITLSNQIYCFVKLFTNQNISPLLITSISRYYHIRRALFGIVAVDTFIYTLVVLGSCLFMAFADPQIIPCAWAQKAFEELGINLIIHVLAIFFLFWI